jgi:AcrR family transcriptional regulator
MGIDSTASQLTTRERILKAALTLFRRHGYHGVGISEILVLAQAPKGSAYHHFPGGKQAIGVAVVQMLAESIVRMFPAPSPADPAAAIEQVGMRLARTMERTDHELCMLFGAFVAQRESAPLLAQAVADAYGAILAELERVLGQGAENPALVRSRALGVLALVEGGAMLAAVHRDVELFRQAVKQAQHLVTLPM